MLECGDVSDSLRESGVGVSGLEGGDCWGGGDLLTIQHFNNTLAITYYELILLLDKLTLSLNQGNIVLNLVALRSKTCNCNR